MFSAPTIDATFDAPWQRFRTQVQTWYAAEQARLRQPWPDSMGDDTILSFELGLYLHDADTDEVVYMATPAPSWIFARTGGDGEHLSVLTAPQHLGLVVLTCPMAFDHKNLIVGQTFGEFLTIMATTGISGLTEICYRGGLSDSCSLRWDPGKLHRVLANQLDLEGPEDVTG